MCKPSVTLATLVAVQVKRSLKQLQGMKQQPILQINRYPMIYPYIVDKLKTC